MSWSGSALTQSNLAGAKSCHVQSKLELPPASINRSPVSGHSCCRLWLLPVRQTNLTGSPINAFPLSPLLSTSLNSPTDAPVRHLCRQPRPRLLRAAGCHPQPRLLAPLLVQPGRCFALQGERITKRLASLVGVLRQAASSCSTSRTGQSLPCPAAGGGVERRFATGTNHFLGHACRAWLSIPAAPGCGVMVCSMYSRHSRHGRHGMHIKVAAAPGAAPMHMLHLVSTSQSQCHNCSQSQQAGKKSEPTLLPDSVFMRLPPFTASPACAGNNSIKCSRLRVLPGRFRRAVFLR